MLRKHWLAHAKKICPRCDIPLQLASLGKTKRRSFFCERCQVKYGGAPAPATPKKARQRQMA